MACLCVSFAGGPGAHVMSVLFGSSFGSSELRNVSRGVAFTVIAKFYMDAGSLINSGPKPELNPYGR